jgi:hypothetical protein
MDLRQTKAFGRMWRPACSRPSDVGSLVFLAIASPVAVLLFSGCQTSPAAAAPGDRLTVQQVVNMPLEKNVSAVAVFYNAYNPWLWNDDRTKIIGLSINALYLIGPNSLGVFGDGIIHPRIYAIENSPDGKQKTPRLVKEWTLDPQEAMPWRSKKKSAIGWGYKPPLIWGDALDLAGKEIRITISFERTDGKIFHSRDKEFIVPARGG